MLSEPVFNPLDKKNLGNSVADALLSRQRSPIPPKERFVGAGVYAIYYAGPFEPYRRLAEANRREGSIDRPIYVGKAIPIGGRKGGLGFDANPGTVLFDRLAEHAQSIRSASKLEC